MSTTIPPASSLLRSFERADAALSLAAGKLETEAGDTFTGAHARLNPARLLRRLSALEAELPKLKEAAARNASARAVLGTLHATINNNQQEALGLARRAHAPIEADADAFDVAEVSARVGLASLPVAPPAAAIFHDAPPPTPRNPPPPTPAAAATPAASEGAVAITAAAPPPPPRAGAAIGDLQWFRLGSSVRDGVSLDDVNQFWSVLRSLFARRETDCLQAAQLLALGVRMSDENARRMRILQALGLVKLQNNAVQLIADPA